MNSIYSQINEVNENEFEVIITDNNPHKGLKCIIEEFPYSNLKYFPTVCEGFLNSFYSITYATGELIKLHNNTMLWLFGSLKKIIMLIKYNIN